MRWLLLAATLAAHITNALGAKLRLELKPAHRRRHHRAGTFYHHTPPAHRTLAMQLGDLEAAIRGPVHLVRLNDSLRLPSPTWLVTCKDCPCDVCELGLNTVGAFGPVEAAIFRHVAEPACMTTAATVVDVGANIGFFTVLAASFGCRVIAFEPQQLPREMAAASLMLNGLEPQVDLHPHVIGEAAGTARFNDESGAWGTNGVALPGGAGGAARDAEVRPLSQFVDGDVLLLKVDTEGYEQAVMAGAKSMFASRIVHNILVEVKQFSLLEKRSWMQQLMRDAGMRYAYNYPEDYGCSSFWSRDAFNLSRVLHNVSDTILAGGQGSGELISENFWFTRERVPFLPG